MTANHDLQRRLASYYASEPPLRAPDWVLQSALETIEDTRQRRGLVALRRYSDMPQLKLAAAAAIVIAVGAFALWQLAQPGPGGPTPPPSPTVAPTPSPAAPTSPEPTTYVPPALTETFTSAVHGLSISYPAGWTIQAATEPWAEPEPPSFGEAAGDFLSDPDRPDHLFVGVVSQSLGGVPLDEWLTDFLTNEGCTTSPSSVAIDGAELVIGTDCGFALASSEGRGYLFVLHTSPDDVDLQAFDADTWLGQILETVRLLPDDAIDAEPTASP